MPFDTQEGIAAAFAELMIGQDVLAKIQALPPVTPERPRKFADIGPILGLDPQGNLYKQLALIDQVIADAAD